MNISMITSATWWRAAGLRAAWTALAVAIPYIGGATFAETPWLLALSASALAAILSLATSLFGLPETNGVDLPWWLAALERVTKTFAQSLAGGLAGATFLQDVDWRRALEAAALAAVISLLRLILATLPEDPTPRVQETVVQNISVPTADDAVRVAATTAAAVSIEARSREHDNGF